LYEIETNAYSEKYAKFKAAKEICAGGATCPALPNLDISGHISFESEYRDLEDNSKIAIVNRDALLINFGSWTVGSWTVGSWTNYEEKKYHLVPTANASDSPFDELAERLPVEIKVNRLLDEIRDKEHTPLARKVADRISDLYESIKDDPDEEPVSYDSLKYFIYFLISTPNLKYPDIVLTPTNEIRAQWRTAPNRHFAVSFMSTGDVRFVIFKPNNIDPDRIDRVSGITTVETLIETVQPLRVLEWALQ